MAFRSALSSLRPLLPSYRGSVATSSIRLYSSPKPPSDRIPTNDPNPSATVPSVSATNNLPVSSDGAFDAPLQESTEDGERQRAMQAPNRREPWSRSQATREVAMSGPRFEQTIMEMQPQPQAAITLIHKQPVRWTDQRIVACDGGGGPLGHPRIFINVDKPQINQCTYCGLPFALNTHRKHLESLPSTPYPLTPPSDPAVVPESQKVTDEPFEQR